MKHLPISSAAIAKTLAVFTLSILTTVAWAQDKGIDININAGSHHEWYENKVLWVAGAAVFILLLVALLRNKKGA